MRFLLFFAIIGSICALQYPAEYHYHYEGQIALGIPAIRPQVAALGIKANLILQMREKTLGVARLTNIEVGEYNDDLQCVHLRQPVPFSYQSMPDPHRETLEQPFVVYFLEESGQVMDVPQSDVEYVTNIRKSIVEMLRVEPILANFGGIKGDQLSKHISDGHAPEAFTVEEESILGRCESEYSLTGIYDQDLLVEKEIIEKHLKKDVQSKSSPRSRTSNIPKLEDDYFRLVRAINFDKCNDAVIQQHAGGANMSHEEYSQFRAVHSRSSVSTYILKGQPGSFRVERAIVEGDVIINPFGFKTQRLQTLTNQTLILESVQSIERPMILPTNLRLVNSWRFEVSSPYSPPQGHQKQWVNYKDKNDKYYPVSLLSSVGISLSSEEIQEYQNTLQDFLDKAVEELYSEPSVPSTDDPDPRMTKGSLATTRLSFMAKIMRILPIENIKEIFTKTFASSDVQSQRKQIFLIDVAAASGASAPIKVLLEKMEKQEISPERIASIFLTLPNNLYSPSVIPELMEYVKRLNIETNPLLTSSALINFASLAERVCINHKKFNYSIPYALFGKEDCGPAQIISDFLPFLEEKAKSASKSHEKAIYLQAINNLGSPEIINILKPYIYGKNDKNLQVRSIAIYGLSRLRLPDSARERVFDILNAVVDNVQERSELRQAAFWTLVTWHPSASWWQRIARSTWRDHSRNFATFFTLTVESLAKSTEPHLKDQSRIAAFVLPLLKPFSPSLRSSYNRIYSRYDPQSKIGVKFDYTMIESEDFEVPFQIYTSLRENYGDLFFQLFEVSVTSDNMGKSISKILNLVRSVDEEKHENINGRNPSDWRPVKSLPRFQSMFSSSDEPQANIYLRAFKNLYQYVPINADVISKIAGNDAENVLKNLLSGVQVHATKYLQPINLEFFLPTEIGLPLKGEVSMPTVNLGEADVKLVAPGLQNPTLKDLLKHDNLSLRFKSNYKYFSELFVKTETLSPWNLKAAKAVVSNYEEMNLPFYGDLSLVRSNEIKNVSLSVSPHIQQKFTVFHQHNVPFTKIGKIVPSSDFTPNYKVVGVEKDGKPALKVRKQLDQSYSGISSEMSYSGDVPYPFTTAFLLDYLRKPEQQGKLLTSPVTKQWQYSLSWDPSSSESRNVTLALSYVNTQPSPDASKGIPDFSVVDDPQERLQKLKEISTGSKVYGLNTQLFFNSPNFRRYEAIVDFTKNIRPVHPPQNAYRIVSAVLTSKIPGHFDSPKALCSDMQMLTPIVYDLNSFKRIVQSHPEKHLSAQIYYGNSCKSSQIAKTQGSLKLSNERQSLVSDELEKVCNHDSKDPAFELQTAAVYDVGTLDIEFLMEKIPISLLNATYSLKEFMEGSLFPHGNYNNMYSGQPNKITVEARRPVSSSKYSFSVATPQKHSIFSEIQVPYFATKIVPFTGLQTSYDNVTDSLLLSLDITPKCTIKKGLITTFDYVKYEFKPVAGTAQCWAIATRDNADNTKTPLYTVRIRQNAEGLQEAQITPDSESPHVEFTYKQAFINGKEMPPDKIIENVNDEDGYPIMTVSKIKDGYKVNLFYTLTTVITSSAIEIFPGYGMRHAVIGLCGDYDRKRDNDKTGPKGCLYTDDQLFEYSWTSSEGDGCDQKQEEQMQTQVKNYQKNCPKRRNPSSKLDFTNIYQSTVDDCTRNVYPVQKKGPSWCAAYEPTLKCKSSCVQVNSKPKKVKAGCWPREKVPEDVSAGEIIGYITNPPAEKAPVNVILALEEAKYCIKLKH